MKQSKTFLLSFILLLLLIGTAEAAELKVILVGTGRGDVEGEDISCPPLCHETYEEKTVVHLKAFPDDDSTFEGWMVNGKPIEGTLTIDQENMLVAARFELIVKPDESEVMWYNGNHKESATLVLDEIAVFLNEEPENWYLLEGEFKTTMEEVAPLFHPQAKVLEWSEFAVVLKSPVPVSKEQLPQIISTIKAHEYIRQAGPVLYSFPGDPSSQIIPMDQIMVQFPATYTEDQITAIEQEYELVRLRRESDDPYYFLYQTSNPLKAIDIANRLFESGQVEAATPNYISTVRLHNGLLEEDSFEHHWHLRAQEQHGADVLGAWELVDKSSGNKPI